MGNKCKSCDDKNIGTLKDNKKALNVCNEGIEILDKFIEEYPSVNIENTDLVEKAKAARKELESNKKAIEQRILMLEDDEDDEDEEPEGDNEDYPPEGKRKPRGTDNEDY